MNLYIDMYSKTPNKTVIQTTDMFVGTFLKYSTHSKRQYR